MNLMSRGAGKKGQCKTGSLVSNNINSVSRGGGGAEVKRWDSGANELW